MMAPERKVPIQKSDFHVLDDEFQSIRGRFENEMKRMEEEMARLRAKLQDHDNQAGSFKSSASIRMSTTEESSSSHKSVDHSNNHWMDDFQSPLIQNGDDGKSLKLRFDVHDYSPEEILVKTIDNKLKVCAKHEEKSPNKTVYREYNREFMLPSGTNPELIKSSLSKDGILTIEAPLPSIESYKERMIPIDKCCKKKEKINANFLSPIAKYWVDNSAFEDTEEINLERNTITLGSAGDTAQPIKRKTISDCKL